MKVPTKFNFGSIVIVEKNLVGVVVKVWVNQRDEVSYEVYVRSLREIQEYPEAEIEHIIYDKELSDEQLEYYS